VLANILAGPLAELRGALRPHRTRRQLLLAGLLEQQAQALIASYAPAWLLSVRAQRTSGSAYTECARLKLLTF
jgi:ribosomal protein L11 methylase PrmA